MGAVVAVALILVAPRALFAASAPPALRPFSRYLIIERRNFFRPRVRPAPADTQPRGAVRTEPGAPDLVLTGVVRIRSTWKAILEKKSEKTSFYVGVDEEADGCTVKSIAENKVVLVKDGREFEIGLRTSAGPEKAPSKTGTKPPPDAAESKGSSSGDSESVTGSELIRLIRTGRKRQNEKKK
jgi:type II secretory pathway component PulC